MNYNAQVLSNVFKVKDTELVRRLLSSAGFYTEAYDDGIVFYDNEDSAYLCCDFTLVKYMNIPIVVLSDNNLEDDYTFAIEEYAGVKEDDIREELIEEVDFFEFLSGQLLEGEAIKVTEVGHEGLRYQSACGVVITTKGYQWFDLNRIMNKYAEENA